MLDVGTGRRDAAGVGQGHVSSGEPLREVIQPWFDIGMQDMAGHVAKEKLRAQQLAR